MACGIRNIAAEHRLLEILSEESRKKRNTGCVDMFPSKYPDNYVITERFGSDMRSLITNDTILKTPNVLAKLVTAVDCFHRLGFVHCDLKPHNILFGLVGGDANFKLCDFDSARHKGENVELNRYTKEWVCPEMYFHSKDGTPLKAKASMDIFSLGLILAVILDREPLPDKTILPAFDEEERAEILSDQSTLDSLANCRGLKMFQVMVRGMLRYDCTLASLIIPPFSSSFVV